MIFSIDDILKITSPGEFEAAAMKVFRHQTRECAPYRDYVKALGINEKDVASVDEIPFLPIEIFKTHKVYCGAGEPEAVFTSSGTGGGGSGGTSKHYVAHLADYERVYTRCFELFYGDPADWDIRSLLPSYEQRGGSSLVYMVDGLKKKHLQGRVEASLCGSDGKKMLIGVSYALLDLAEELSRASLKPASPPIHSRAAMENCLSADTVIMETGGMKGRRDEMPKSVMHSVLQQAFGVPEIHSEYGMAELMSQAYSHGRGIFRTPPWMRVLVRDLADPFDIKRAGQSGELPLRGGINIIDLANLNSCAFIQTQDVGTIFQDGSFTIDGREVKSDIRGCNLLVQ